MSKSFFQPMNYAKEAIDTLNNEPLETQSLKRIIIELLKEDGYYDFFKVKNYKMAYIC